MAKTSQLPAAQSPAPVLQLVPAPFQAKRPRPYTPRPYQQRCIAALAEARAQGETSALVVMASGLGKTPTLIFDLEQYLTEFPDARVLFLCDQETILVQSKAKFRKYFGEEYSYGLYSGSHKTLHRVNFMFATLQSVRDHPEDFPIDAYDYIAVDEAHHSSADTYAPTIQRFQYRFLLGLTATPDREDGRNILDIYGRVVFEMDVFDGWAEGYLAPTDYRLMLDDFDERELQKCLDPEYSGMKISMAQLNRTIFAPKRDDEIVAAIREQTADLENPRIFVFCNNIQHAETMAEHFGGEAAVVHSGQSSSLNFAILSAFQAGQINIVISVNMLNEGVDVPEADCVVFLRVTDVKRIFFQQLGRGLRLSTGKRVVRVLDFVSAIERIVMILEMEETAKQRIKPESSFYPFSAKRLPPITVNVRATKFRIQRVDLEQLLSRIRRMLSHDDIIRTVQKYAEEHNLTELCHSDIRSLFANITLKKMFGDDYSRKVIEAAGLKYYRASNVWTKESIIQAFKDNVTDGQLPSPDEIKSNPAYPNIDTVNRYFPDRQALADATGLTLLAADTDDSLLLAYLKASLEAGKWLNGREIDAHQTLKSRTVYRNHFGGLTRLPELAAKLYPERVQNANLMPPVRSHTPHSIELKIHTFIRTNRRLPTTTDFKNDPSLPAYQLCYKYCGVRTLPDLLLKCHAQQVLDEVGEEPTIEPNLSDEDVEALRRLVTKLGRKLQSRDLRPANGTKSYGYLQQHGFSLAGINTFIGADQILAELATENN